MGNGIVVVHRGGVSWWEKVTWGVYVGVGLSSLSLRVRGCSSEFTGTRESVLFDELSRDGGRVRTGVFMWSFNSRFICCSPGFLGRASTGDRTGPGFETGSHFFLKKWDNCPNLFFPQSFKDDGHHIHHCNRSSYRTPTDEDDSYQDCCRFC